MSRKICYSLCMKITIEKNILFFALIIFSVFLSVLFFFTSAERANQGDSAPRVSASPDSVYDRDSIQTPDTNSPIKVIEDNNSSRSTVRYEHGTFTPIEIVIKSETGCFVQIENASNESVIPRVGPYVHGKEKGFLYPSVAPGGSGLIDPRYGHINQFSFYNKNKPNAVFIVHIDPTCL